jgi:hypothetical protein
VSPNLGWTSDDDNKNNRNNSLFDNDITGINAINGNKVPHVSAVIIACSI